MLPDLENQKDADEIAASHTAGRVERGGGGGGGHSYKVGCAAIDGPRVDVTPLAVKHLHEALHLWHVVEWHAAIRGGLLGPAFVERALDLEDARKEGDVTATWIRRVKHRIATAGCQA